MKRRGCVWAAAMALAALLSGCGEKERYVYTEEDRPEMFVNQNASRLYNPGVETNIGLADLIAEVEITSLMLSRKLARSVSLSIARPMAR